MPEPLAASRPDVTIVTSGHDVADARLHRHVHALTNAGLAVEVFGLGDAVGGPPVAVVSTYPHRGRAIRAWRALRLPFRARGKVVVAFDPDAAIGVLLVRWLRRPWPSRRAAMVVDVHEDYRLLLHDRKWARGVRGVAGRTLAALGAWATCRADAVVVADEHLMPELPDRLVVRNYADPAFLPSPTDPDDQPRAIYIGDLRESRGLFAMLATIRDAPRWSLDLIGRISEADRATVTAQLESPQLSGRVRLHGRLAPRRAWQFSQGAWVGLLLLEDTPAFREAVPSKLYEYLHCGLPVLSSPMPRTAALLAASGSGVVVENAIAAAAQLRAWSDDPKPLLEMRANAVNAVAYDQTQQDAFVALCVRLTK